jgi:hypothetical protein
MAVDNALCLELGYAGKGSPANNFHSGPMHPEHDPSVERLPYDPDKAMSLMKEAGMEDYEHEITSIDDDWRKNTTDSVAAQLRDAGFKVKRTILPGSTFWNDWTKYAFSSTNWNHRPFATQVWGLAYGACPRAAGVLLGAGRHGCCGGTLRKAGCTSTKKVYEKFVHWASPLSKKKVNPDSLPRHPKVYPDPPRLKHKG